MNGEKLTPITNKPSLWALSPLLVLNNLSIDKAEEVEIAFAECDPKHVTAAILTNDMHAYNTFEDPDKVHEEVFTEYKIADGRITFTMPACSVVMFRIK